MDNASQDPSEIAELARKMTLERRGRFLDAACGGNAQLRAAVELILNAPGNEDSAPASDGDLEAMVLEAVASEALTEKTDQDADRNEPDQSTPIVEYAREKKLDPIARLRLFQKVCRLVDESHRRGIIHGGLSPELILIGPEGEPRVSPREPTDAIPEDADAASLRYTSPERILGEPLTTATDVYGLGVILYELLAGRYPYQTVSPTPGRDELFDAISKQAPERPSRALDQTRPVAENQPAQPAEAIDPFHTRLRKLLDSDLDLIVLKSMRKEPERRYASAAALAEDIDRFLNGRPVQAHQPGRRYVLEKFIRRHPVATLLGLALTAALGLGLVGSVLGLIRTRRERSQAEASYREAHEALDELFTRIDREYALAAPDLRPARTAMLETLLHHYEQVSIQPGGTFNDRLEAARARQRVGRIYQLMGLSGLAVWQYEEAANAFKELEREPKAKELQEEQADLLRSLGDLLRANADRRGEARSHLERAHSLLESGSNVNLPPPTRRALARVLGSLAELDRDEGHLDKAAANWQKAVAIHRELASGSTASVDDRIALASSLMSLGNVLAMAPEPAGQGLGELKFGVELRQEIVRAFPQRFDQVGELARDLRDVAALEQKLGQLGAAVEDTTRAVALYEQLDRRFPDNVSYQTDLYVSYDALSRLLALRHEYEPALERSNQAKAVLERLTKQQPKSRLFPLDLSRCHNLIGRIQQRLKKYPEALQSFQRAVDLLEGMPGVDGESSYQLAVNLALCVSLFGANADMPPPDDESTLSDADKVRRQVYGKRAVSAIERAINEGFGNRELYRTDGDLDALQDRPDFQKLIQRPADAKPNPAEVPSGK